jgi:hypothetical protein
MGLNAKSFEPRSALAAYHLFGAGAVDTAGIVDLGIVRTKGRIRRFMVSQRTTGTGGTSATYALKKRRATTESDVLGTAAVLTLAAGVGAGVDSSKANDAVATPSGCTKPVLSSVAGALDVNPGDQLYVVVSHSGVYSPDPAFLACVEVVPRV